MFGRGVFRVQALRTNKLISKSFNRGIINSFTLPYGAHQIRPYCILVRISVLQSNSHKTYSGVSTMGVYNSKE